MALTLLDIWSYGIPGFDKSRMPFCYIINGIRMKPLLDRIVMVTLCCPDLAAVEEAYQRYLHYRTVSAGRVSAQLAHLWGAEAAAGADYALLAPAGDMRHFIRLLQVDTGSASRPFSVAGWGAAEILVNDVDSLAHSLAGSPFRVVGLPEDLSFTDKIRATQVIGPAGEALYLTQVKEDLPDFSLAPADRAVAWCFVVVLAATSLTAAREFYLARFAIDDAPVIDARVTMMSAAFDLPRERLHRISALALGNPGYLLEVDELPHADDHRQARQGLLPPGIAIVSFSCSASPDQGGAPVLSEPPYDGRQVGFCTGTSGEMLELIYS